MSETEKNAPPTHTCVGSFWINPTVSLSNISMLLSSRTCSSSGANAAAGFVMQGHSTCAC
jgi:hypothetical protein